MSFIKINVFEDDPQKMRDHLSQFPPEMEGHIGQIPDQIARLKELSKSSTRILEIGFNAGHSSRLFLDSSPDATILSFDLGTHDYCMSNKEDIDQQYPGRHTLIVGDSTKTVPQYAGENPDAVFDLIFIDGGHKYELVKADFINCKKLADENTIVVMDDIVIDLITLNSYSYLQGPSTTWREAIESQQIKHIRGEEYLGLGRGMAWFKYNMYE